MIDNGKRNVLGVLVNAIDYESALDRVISAARERRSFALTALAVHGVMTGVHDRAHAARLNGFDVVTPDGQPVRWALNLLHNEGLTDQVAGTPLTMMVLERCAAEGLPVYLYGSTEDTLARLTAALTTSHPALQIAGAEPSKFRPTHPGEDVEIARRIRDSGARVVLVGLGCPRQEVFTFAMRELLDVPVVAVGAAFDYHAGQLRRAPVWMQRHALEWLWRLGLEPRRLWRRYLFLNPAYLVRLSAQKLGLWRAIPPAPSDTRPTSFAV